MFQRVNFKVIAHILSIFLLICIATLSAINRFDVSTEKSSNKDSPVPVSAGEKIEITVSRVKGDNFWIKAYWEDNPQNGITLTPHFFTDKGTITAPDEKGEHTLIIEASFLDSRRFYYIVE